MRRILRENGLSITVFGLFLVFLRQKGSPESKPVAAAHAQTGAS